MGNEIYDNGPFGSVLPSVSFAITFNQIGTNLLSAMVYDNDNDGPTGFGGRHVTVVNGLLTVNPALAFGLPEISVPYGTMAQGQSEVLSTNAINGTPPYTYEWELDGQRLVQAGPNITLVANTSDIGLRQ